jgi:hypothetical protein
MGLSNRTACNNPLPMQMRVPTTYFRHQTSINNHLNIAASPETHAYAT